MIEKIFRQLVDQFGLDYILEFSDNTLHVPFGISEDGRLVKPSQAVNTDTYYCPECKGKLKPRQGEINVHHFAHYTVSQCDFTGESLQHYKAKYLVQQRFVNYLQTGVNPPVATLQCTRCKKAEPIDMRLETGVDAHVEYRVNSNFGTYVADMAMVNAVGEPACVIEVLHTHAVDNEKRKKIGDTRWIEIKASEVLERHSPWHVVATNQVSSPYVCKTCEETERRVQEEKMAAAKKADWWCEYGNDVFSRRIDKAIEQFIIAVDDGYYILEHYFFPSRTSTVIGHYYNLVEAKRKANNYMWNRMQNRKIG